jgi:hypothetical protein
MHHTLRTRQPGSQAHFDRRLTVVPVRELRARIWYNAILDRRGESSLRAFQGDFVIASHGDASCNLRRMAPGRDKRDVFRRRFNTTPRCDVALTLD